jgi:desampylase
MTVLLPQHVRAELIAHARQEAPNECCGMLIGRGAAIERSVRVRNVADTPATRYRIDPAEHISLNRRLRGSSLSVVGAYHSHPRSAAVPSETDRCEALYPEFVWLIVSLAGGAGEIGAFRLTADRLVNLSIVEY